MRIVIFYDLPFFNEKMVKDYNLFRKNLLKNGFKMMQFSIYTRICPNKDNATGVINKIKSFLPQNGSIRSIIITEKQYQNIEILRGTLSEQEKIINERRILIL